MKLAPLLLTLVCSLGMAAEPDEFEIPPQAVESFARRIQSALTQRDVPRVLDLVAFPLRVNTAGGKVRRIGRNQLVKDFDQVFTPAVIKEVLEQDPAHLFQNYQGVMFGNGAVWASEFCKDQRRPHCPLRVITVNRPAH